jgi:hypothetical protein
MEQDERISLINEIKQIERELYLKRSQLASSGDAEGSGIYQGLNATEWKDVFSRCTEEIGRLSSGGNSVEDVAAERQR